MELKADRRLVVAVTGASGSAYAVRFLQAAVDHFTGVYLIISDQAREVLAHETGVHLAPDDSCAAAIVGRSCPHVRVLDRKDFFSPPASGSFVHDGMVIVPCSMGTAGRIANGMSDDLLTRAADVCLKERRRLILVPRETPWNLVHLRNFTQLAEAGATILPACPGFYHHPETVSDLIDHIVARILQQLDVRQDLVKEWRHEQE